MREMRRRFVRTLAAGMAAVASGAIAREPDRGVPATFTVVTLGDSVLDCGRYNPYGVHPGQLLVRNDDELFPEFRGRDLAALGRARLEHRAHDGGRVDDLPRQAQGLRIRENAVALVTVGGNDLVGGLAADRGAGIEQFQRQLERFLRSLAVRPVLLGTVYDPTFGDDQRNFLAVDAGLARANLDRMNAVLAEIAPRYGALVDIHAHFLGGDPSWFSQTIEPSLRGASEVRAAFLPGVLRARGER